MTTGGHDDDEVPRTLHDGFFKEVFSDPALAAEELRAVLPPALAASIDWPALRPAPASFVDAVFRQRAGDLVFQGRFRGGGALLVWFLLEHQSTEDWWMLARIIDMESKMWRSWRKLHPGASRLPVIVPVVVYNGHRPWQAPTDMHALYDVPDELGAALGTNALSCSFVLDDLGAIEDETLRSRRMDAYARLCLFVMARAAAEDFLDRLAAWRTELLLVLAAPDRERAEVLLRYTFRAHRHADPDTVRHRIGAVVGPEQEDIMLSVADQLIQQGFDKGIEKGLEKGQRTLLLRLLGKRFGAVPAHVADRVAAAPPADLERWFDRAIDASSLDDIFEGA
jgi:hypothetical protein